MNSNFLMLNFFFSFSCEGNPNMVMALAGNKADLLDAKKVAAEASYQFLLHISFAFKFKHYNINGNQ